MDLLRYVPPSKRPAIRDAYEDCDGFWLCLHEGWEATRSTADRTIHEDTVRDLRYQIAGIRKVKRDR